MPQPRTIAITAAGPWTGVEANGDVGVVVYYGRGRGGGVAALYGSLKMGALCRDSDAPCRDRRAPGFPGSQEGWSCPILCKSRSVVLQVKGSCRLKQSNGEDTTIGPLGSSSDVHPTHDLSGLRVCQLCWLPTRTPAAHCAWPALRGRSPLHQWCRWSIGAFGVPYRWSYWSA